MSTQTWCCPICLEENEDNCYTLEPCNHRFHTRCIINSLRLNGPQCPYCRGIQTNIVQNSNDILISNNNRFNFSNNNRFDWSNYVSNNQLELLDAFYPNNDVSNNIFNNQNNLSNNSHYQYYDNTTYDLSNTHYNNLPAAENPLNNISADSIGISVNVMTDINSTYAIPDITTEVYLNPS